MHIQEFELFGLTIPFWFIYRWLNILTANAVFAYIAYRQGTAWEKLLPLLLLTSFGGGIGFILIPDIMGVLAFSILFLFAGLQIMRIHRPVGGLLAIFIAVSLPIAKIGCYLSGCCFGTTTDLPWGIQYSAGTPAHWLHFQTNKIADASSLSLPLHPIQLYEMIFSIVLAILMIRWYKKVKNPNALLPAFFGLYLWFRFFIEFIRDTNHVWWSVVNIGPLSAFQWFLLVAGVLYVYWAFRMVKGGSLSHGMQFLAGGSRLPATLILIIVYLGTIALYRSFQTIQIVQLVVLILVVGAFNYPQLAVLSSRPKVGITLTTIALVILVMPFGLHLRGKIVPRPGVAAITMPEQTILYVIHPPSGKLIRLGDENISFSQFSNMGARLELGDQAAQVDPQIFGSIRMRVESREMIYWGQPGYGPFQVETCDGFTAYVNRISSDSM